MGSVELWTQVSKAEKQNLSRFRDKKHYNANALILTAECRTGQNID